MLHYFSVNKSVYEPGKPREQFKTMLKEIYSQSAYHMSGSYIYCSHSWLPSLHLILVSWSHVSQKYSPLVLCSTRVLYSITLCCTRVLYSSTIVLWTILQRKWFKKRGLSMPFILPKVLLVMNCSFPLFMLPLPSHVADSPVSSCNISLLPVSFSLRALTAFSIACCSPVLLFHPQHPLFATGLALLYICSYTHGTSYDCWTEQLKYAQ